MLPRLDRSSRLHSKFGLYRALTQWQVSVWNFDLIGEGLHRAGGIHERSNEFDLQIQNEKNK